MIRNILATILLLASTIAPATNVTIVDYMLGYEHHYSRCNINLHIDNIDKYLYATCGSYAAPPKDYLRGDWTSVVYDEIGVNGVNWNRCKLVGEPIFEIRFECNMPLKLYSSTSDIFGQIVQPVLMTETVVYDPFR